MGTRAIVYPIWSKILGFTAEAPWARPLAAMIFGLHRGPRTLNKGRTEQQNASPEVVCDNKMINISKDENLKDTIFKFKFFFTKHTLPNTL